MALSKMEREYILAKAWVPEHSVDIMTRISGAEAYLQKGYVYFWDGSRLIFIGYPLEGVAVDSAVVVRILDEVTRSLKPSYVNIVASSLPRSLVAQCLEIERDEYWRVDLEAFAFTGVLRRALRRALKECSICRLDSMGEEHKILLKEFVKRKGMTTRAEALYTKAQQLFSSPGPAIILEARSRAGLAAISIVDTAPANFDTYLLGATSLENRAPGASDLLMYEMIQMASNEGKRYLNVGLGVNDGIRRFKKKWGAEPYVEYRHCGFEAKRPSFLEAVLNFRKKGL